MGRNTLKNQKKQNIVGYTEVRLDFWKKKE